MPGAIANAIYNACGVRIREHPITREKIMAGLKAWEASMNRQGNRAAALAAVVVLLAQAPAAGQQATTGTSPRTMAGHPDLQGVLRFRY